MRVGSARAAARDWIERHGSREPGFLGAYVTGSTVGMADEARLPPGSDLDLVVVTLAPPEVKLGKFLHQGALLEVTHQAASELSSPEAVLSSYHLATPFVTDTILADPTGRLARLRAAVAREFAEPRWVRARWGEARRRVEDGLRGLDPAADWPRAVLGWLFPTGVTTHVLLVAGLRNPTVRLRYLAVGELLDGLGHPERHARLLDLLGCGALTAGRAARHLDALAVAFDAAAAVARTPFPFRSDISQAARPIALDASRRLIEAGRHREVAFWLAATFARCHVILGADGDAGTESALAPAFHEMCADLGIASPADLRERAARVLAFLPTLEEWAEETLAATLAARRLPG
ncbi:hypothetical protein [Streptomyces hoynatensis]|uniref:Nucleotidyltransferase domain-containing protein n=1 Tax=Streptomyces hoynatensis TaxID=1141874 RepID=A0A3A9YZG4_9ACTN|nr:hypothetical protein [Streptomyces hoynatensis]RKN41345.1 hypothetical protein D7294_16165 [Streptomyces hoynatensis]